VNARPFRALRIGKCGDDSDIPPRVLQEPPLSPSDEAERLRLFISRISDYAIYMLSPEGVVASWNAGAQRFKGYTAQEIIGQHFSRFYTEEDRAAGVPQNALRKARETGKFEAEGWRVRKDGTRFWAHVFIDPICDEAGQLVGSPRSPGTSPTNVRPSKRCAKARNASGCSCRASPTTPSTCCRPPGR
jgi:PAS domain S-box-containing protein